jgi:hypothetical protein
MKLKVNTYYSSAEVVDYLREHSGVFEIRVSLTWNLDGKSTLNATHTLRWIDHRLWDEGISWSWYRTSRKNWVTNVYPNAKWRVREIVLVEDNL